MSKSWGWCQMAIEQDIARARSEEGYSMGAVGGAVKWQERADAIKLAERVLDRPNADPDDDLAVLARQFLKAIEYERAIGAYVVIDMNAPAGIILHYNGKDVRDRAAEVLDHIFLAVRDA